MVDLTIEEGDCTALQTGLGLGSLHHSDNVLGSV